MRGFNYKKTVQALNYIAILSGGQVNKMKAIKLIWLSDRYHLRKYARLITGDTYFALPLGPVPSSTRDFLQDSPFLSDIESDYKKYFIEIIDKYEYKSINEVDFKVFSKTDIEMINTIFKNYSKYDHFELSELSHSFPEWKRYESALKARLGSSFPIIIEDFFNKEDDINLNISDSEESLALAKEIYSENNLYCLALS